MKLLTAIYKLFKPTDLKSVKKPAKKTNQSQHDYKKILHDLSRTDTVAIDFETATAKRSSACAIGIVLINKFEIINNFYQLIRPPENTYNKINISIHGISPQDTKNAPTFDEIWKRWLNAVINSNAKIAAHNARFDMSVLRESLQYYGIDTCYINATCTVDIARNLFPGLKNHKLPTIAKHIGFTLNHHDPVSDATGAAKILIAWREINKEEILKKEKEEKLERKMISLADSIKMDLKKAKDFEKELPKESAKIYLDSIKKIRDVFDKHGRSFYLPRMPINRFSLLLERTKKYKNCVQLLNWYQNYDDPVGQTSKDQENIEKRMLRAKKKLKENVSK